MNKFIALCWKFILILSQTMLFEQRAWAAESHLSPGLAVYWTNFLIYIAILYLILKKPLARTWANRRETLINEVARLAAELNNVEGELRKAQFKMRSLAEEKELLKQNILERAENEAEEIIKNAQKKADAIQTAAKSIIAIEKRAMINRQKLLLAEMVANSAKEIISKKFTPNIEKNIREKALRSLEMVN